MRPVRRRLRPLLITLAIFALLAFAFWWTRAWWAAQFPVAAAWWTGVAWPWLDRNKGPLGGLYPIVAIVGVIAVFVFNWLRHRRETAAARHTSGPLTPFSREELFQTPGFDIEYVQRGLVTLNDLEAPPYRVALTGESRLGKSREAAELIRDLVVAGEVAETRLYKPNASQFAAGSASTVVKAMLTQTGDAHIDLTAPLLVFIDDLPHHFRGAPPAKRDAVLKEIEAAGFDDLENLRVVLDYLARHAKRCYVVLTARVDEMAPGVHQPWLDRCDFATVSLSLMDRSGQDNVAANTIHKRNMSADNAALAALQTYYNGTPGRIVRILEHHNGLQNYGPTVTAQSIHALAPSFVAKEWEAVRYRVRQEIPHGVYILDALADFYLARVTPRRGLVFDYAAFLLRQDIPPGRGPLGRALAHLHRTAASLSFANRISMAFTLIRLLRFGVVDLGGILSYSGIEAAEHAVPKGEARDRLADYLPRRRLPFLLARFSFPPRYMGLTRRALVELAGEYGRGDPKLRVAVDLGSLAIALDPTDALAYTNRGNARLRQGDPDAAVADYDEATRLDSANANAYYNRGLARSRQGDLDAAIADYDEVIRINPADADAFINRGLARFRQGDPDAAVVDYDEAIRLNPDYALAYKNRGLARFRQGDSDAAVADYDEAIRLNPAYTNAYYNRGNARFQQGDLDAAVADYDEAIRLNPAYAIAYSRKGTVLRALQNWDRAEVAHRAALDLDPTSVYDWLGLADIARRRNDVCMSRAYLSRAEPLLDADDAYDIACFESIAGHTDLALDFLAQAIAAKPHLKRDALHDPDLAWIRDHPRFREIAGPPSDPPSSDLPDPA